MAKTVEVFTMDSCPYCEAAKALLRQRGVEYSEIKLSQEDDAAWNALYKRSGMKTVPQIFTNAELIGGFQELAQMDKKDHLESLKRS